MCFYGFHETGHGSEKNGAHTAENSDVSKRADTSKVKPKCVFDFYNTYTHSADNTDHCLSSYSIGDTKNVA
jgi:hypothetical protein